MKFTLIYILPFLFVISLSCSHDVQDKQIDASDSHLALDNGVLYYDASPFSGNIISNFDNGVLKSDIQYVGGRKNGYESHWYANGKLAVERYYTMGVKTGIHKGFWENADPKFEYSFNNNGEYNGELREWYSSGQLFKEFHYVNGQEVGSQKLWKTDGRIKANYEVYNGERFGLIGLKKCATVSVDTNYENL